MISDGVKFEEANTLAAWKVKDDKAMTTIILSLTSM